MLLLVPMAFATGLAWPAMVVSASTVDFGLVPLGGTVTDTFTVTNSGDLPMGLRAELDGWPDGDLSYSWDQGACDDGTPLLPGVELQVDTGGAPFLPDAVAEPGAEAILPPGCTVTFDVTYSPTEGDRALAALTLTASGDYPHGRSDFQTELPAYFEDPVEFRQVVALAGQTDGEELHSGLVFLAMDGSPDVCWEGETVVLQTWGFAADGGELSYSWGTDAAEGASLFDDVFLPSPTFTCPEVEAECGSRLVEVYVIVNDPEGHQLWAEELLEVIDSSRSHPERFVEGQDTCSPPPRSPEPGCGESGAVMLLGVGWGMVSRRRRRR